MADAECQPKPIPESSAARMSQSTLWDPCRPPAWLGETVHILDVG